MQSELYKTSRQDVPLGRAEQKVFCVFALSVLAPAEVAAGCNNLPQDLKIDQNASHDRPACVWTLHNYKDTLRA